MKKLMKRKKKNSRESGISNENMNKLDEDS